MASEFDIRIPASHIDPMYYMADAIPNSFYASPATEDEVAKMILGLPNKGCNLNCVPVFVYKKTVQVLSPIITDIFDSSIAEGVFPDALKVAPTMPIHKG